MTKNRENAQISVAQASDQPAILDLIPMLADFDVPAARNPDDLWMSDAELIRQHFAGSAPQTRVLVVKGAEQQLLGFALVSIGEEPLSHASNAHLEAIVVAPEGRGLGLGRRLMAATEHLAREEGVSSVTLNAFANNRRARNLYESLGFDGELIRYIKRLPSEPSA
ncbi:MAG: GNAT family N-acetyltransferase [Pseudomonadota bacterium]